MTEDEFRILIDLRAFGPQTAVELASGIPNLQRRQISAKLRSMCGRGLVYASDPVAHIWDLAKRGNEVVDA